MMVVDIAEGRPSPARPFIDPWAYGTTNPARHYEVLEDGEFFISRRDAEIYNDRDNRRVDEIQVVLNFFEVLRQRVATEPREIGSG